MAEGGKAKFVGYVTSVKEKTFSGHLHERGENGEEGEELTGEFNVSSLKDEDRKHLQDGIPFEILMDEEKDAIEINLIIRYWTPEMIADVEAKAKELEKWLQGPEPK